jgi:predicted O-methyltransferase YrrM
MLTKIEEKSRNVGGVLPFQKKLYIMFVGEPEKRMNLVNTDIEKYLTEIIPERDPVLSDMEEFAAGREFPIIGPLVGRLLYILTISTKAKRILELGSGYGYSAYWFAKAAGKDGTVICTDGSAENRTRAIEYFTRGRIVERIEFHVGDALKLVDSFDGEFDIIFNDIDKAQYPKALRKALPKLKKGGLFIADNVLWSGRILDKRPDTATAGIVTFNRMLFASKDLFTSIVPLRDGVSVSVKL